MGLKPAKCYRKLERPYTRQSRSKPKRSYVKGVPYPKIHKFEAGKRADSYSCVVSLVANNSVQIRHNALEAARVGAHKILTKHLGVDGFFLKVLVYPHHVLRENSLATGAGADRFQTGMRQSFGKPVSTAARVMANQSVMEVRVPGAKKLIAKNALKVAGSKLPTTTRIVFETN